MQSQSFHHAICMRLRPKMMQIAVQYASSCDAWRVYLHFKVAGMRVSKPLNGLALSRKRAFHFCLVAEKSVKNKEGS